MSKVQHILDILKVPFAIGKLHCITQTVRSTTTGGLQKSRTITIYTFFVLSFYCWNATRTIFNTPPSFYEKFLENGYTWFCVGAGSNTIVKFVLLDGIISAFFNRGKQILFFEKINAIDLLLSRQNDESINYNFFKFYAILINTYPIIFFIYFSKSAALIFSRLKGVTSLNVLNTIFPFYLENVCNFLLVFAYTTDVIIICMRFRALSNVLLRIKKNIKTRGTISSVLQVYSELFGSIDIVNRSYGNNIILRNVHDFVGIVGGSYIFSLVLQSTHPNKYYVSASVLSLFFFNCLKVFVQTLSTQLTVTEVCNIM